MDKKNREKQQGSGKAAQQEYGSAQIEFTFQKIFKKKK